MPEQELILDDIPLEITPEMRLKTAKEVRDNCVVLPQPERTYVIVVAVHRDQARNIVSKISCKKGLPLGGYVYDSQTDTYHVDCSDFLHLGYVPASFTMRVKGVDDWEARIPMPESVLKKYLNPLQKKELRNFRTHFRQEDYHIQFIQMIDPN